jgi:tRNA-dihydrouridine synthase A
MPPHPSIQNPAEKTVDRRFSVAPMMECTDRHDRFLLRLITRHALLYTEMITSNALINGDRARLLRFDEAEHPVALQVGGSEPGQMAECARYVESYGYDEINVNVGCPSNRVQSGRFGACLMAEPNLVADCVDAMQAVVAIPVTVKTRIGIDRDESLDQLGTFVDTVAGAGCKTFIVHARRAWLSGISPKQNRQVPPLNYERVYELKRSRPDLTIVINGGIKTLDAAGRHLDKVDGVMMGREAYATPYLLAQVDNRFYGSRSEPLSREAVLEHYLEYCEREVKNGCALNHMSRHLTGLFHGQAGARRWRRCVNEHAGRTDAGVELIRRAALRRARTTGEDHYH